MDNIMNAVSNWITRVGFKIVVSFAAIVVSFLIINKICSKLKKTLEKRETLDTTLTRALTNVAKFGLKILVIVGLVGYLGIETSSISAVIGSAGVAIGLAINGTLSNLSGGAMLLLTRPISVGDYIEAQGMSGIVQDIQICFTKIATYDNKIIYLPNSALSTGVIVNYTQAQKRRVDLDFSIKGNDPILVKKVLLGICKKDKLILSDPKPFARITDFGAGNGTIIQLRAWCKSEDYWEVYSNILEDAQAEFEAHNIVVPCGQLDVHLDHKKETV